MDRYGISRANAFRLDEHDRHPGLPRRERPDARLCRRAPDGRLIPFVRLDLTESPIEEAKRCLDLGARGIKLHPRAQKFQLERPHGSRLSSRLPPSVACRSSSTVAAGCRRSPTISRRLVDEYPDAQLIIAHAGIADLSGLAGHFAGKTGVFFDTSVWSPIDLLSFYRLVPPEQIVYASDYPYGMQPQSLLLVDPQARARQGLTEEQLVEILAGKRTGS